MFEHWRKEWVAGSVLMVLSAAACSDRHHDQGADAQPDGSGGESPGGASSGDDAASGGSSGDGEGIDFGGAGAGGQAAEEEAATVALEAAVGAVLGGSELVTDVSVLVKYTYELRDCIGPYEVRMPWNIKESDSDFPLDPWDWTRPSFCPKLTLHFIGEDDGLALVAEMPTETFPYAEQLKLEQRGGAWLVKDLTTSSHLSLHNEDDTWVTDYYKAALAVFAFADDNQDGKPDRVVTAATNSVEGLLTLAYGEPFNGYDSDLREGWVKWGKAEGLALSQGALPLAFRDEISAAELDLQDVGELVTPGFSPPGSIDGEIWSGDLPVITLSAPVRSDSVFYFENAQGERSKPKMIPVGQYVDGKWSYFHGIWPVDYLAEGWDLVGEGTKLDGRPFSIRQPFTLFDLAVSSGDFESDTPLNYPTRRDGCTPAEGAGVAESFGSLPALIGAHSFYASGCPRVRIKRAPSATQLKFEARRVEPCSGVLYALQVMAMAPGGKSLWHTFECADGDALITVTAPLPASGDDLLVQLPDGYWIDSLRTE